MMNDKYIFLFPSESIDKGKEIRIVEGVVEKLWY